MTEERKAGIQNLYSQGYDISQICQKIGVKADTLKKSVRAGKLVLTRGTTGEGAKAQTKSERSLIDDGAGMGKACINALERVLSCKTGLPCPIDFTHQVDLHQAGVLLSLPALIANGLLKHEKDFFPDTGYYSISSVFITLAFLALLRVNALAQSGNVPAGELGKSIGLDRIPEVKTLRERIALFCQKADIENWGQKLSKDWLEGYPDLSGALYIDGHVKIYYGRQTDMPKRYVSRLRLCMSGSTDYWVNDMLGQPFFVVNKVVTGGMIEVIKQEILPRLDEDVPSQPTPEILSMNSYLHRYMIVFDRECYSPDFFFDLWQERVAICTYNKNVKDKWPDEEFMAVTHQPVGGLKEEIVLAERGVLLQNKGSNKKIWAREIRKKSPSGHQTSIITTNYMLQTIMVGVFMFARWSQENFFKYVMGNFGIDTLVSYLKEKISETAILINPLYRELENQQKKLTSRLNIRKAAFASIILGDNPMEDARMRPFLNKKAELIAEINALEDEIGQIKEKKQVIPRKITFGELPEDKKFDNAINQRKLFLDTIKMIAYRAETAMANCIRPNMSHPDEARKLLQQVYQTDADIIPDYDQKTLTIRLHKLAYWKDDKIIEKLCSELNDTKTKFPGSDLVLLYKMVSL